MCIFPQEEPTPFILYIGITPLPLKKFMDLTKIYLKKLYKYDSNGKSHFPLLEIEFAYFSSRK